VIYAIDCDLHRACCVAENKTIVEHKSMDRIFDTLPGLVRQGDVVLFEIASAINYRTAKTVAEQRAMTHQTTRWMLYNVWAAGVLAARLAATEARMFVAPSNVWTKGYSEEQRRLLARCTRPNHDLREAEAMIWFYRATPTDWVPLDQWASAL
jgi:hypothetical protein